MGGPGDGFEVALDDIAELQRTWGTQEALITPMAGKLAGMLGEITAAANAAMDGKSRSEKEAIAALAQSAQRAVSAAQGAVKALSAQLTEDAGKLSQTADTYRVAEARTKDHVTSIGQLAAAAPPGGGGYGGSGSGSGSGSAGGGGGYSGGTGTPVAPDMVASSAQVKDWVAQAIEVLEQHGVPASKLDPNAIALIIQHESGGNPNAVNHWDINAQEGHPSEGLMQTIGPTFSEYSLPGHGNILNPVDNIIAGCQYAISRYGSLDNVPGVVAVAHGGSYVGY